MLGSLVHLSLTASAQERGRAWRVGARAVALAARGVVLVAPELALAQNDMGGLDAEFQGQDRSDELTVIIDLITTFARIVEDYIAPLMGVVFMLAGVNEGARRGDLAGALRYFVFGLLCFGVPYLIDIFTAFMS